MERLPPAARILQQRRVPYELHRFDPQIRSADAVASCLGVAPAAVYKTLVLQADEPRARPIILMAPAGNEVDLRKVADALHCKRVRMASAADARRLTGMELGAISAIPLIARRFDMLIAEEALDREDIFVSSGERGADVLLAVRDLLALTGARTIAL